MSGDEVSGQTGGTAGAADGGAARAWRPLAWAALGFALLLLPVYADVLFSDSLRMPSHPQGDVSRYFLWMRLFGYSELRGGNLPLWNPHVFSGTPYVGVFQSAIFYPPNLFHLVLDLRRAVTLELALHQWLIGVLGFAWLHARRQGMPRLHGLAAFAGAAAVVFGSAVSLRVLAGQLSVLGTIAWWPLLLLAIDRLAERIRPGWILAGSAALALMLLAGHPPTTLQGGVAAGLYCLPLLRRSERRLPLLAAWSAMAAGGVALAAVQVLTGLHTAAEGLRGEGMSYLFATSHSFPPEQLLTLLVPEAFGNASEFHLSYFGRVFYWDATFYFGVVGLVLAVHGALAGRGPLRNVALVLCALLAVTAMGGYTPLYRAFYEWVPGFTFIRAPSKFLFYASAFAGALVAIGLDRLLSDPRGAARAAGVALGLAALCLVLGAWTALAPASWQEGSSPMALLAGLARGTDFVIQGEPALWHRLLLRGSAVACATALLAALLLFASARRRVLLFALVALALLELVAYARLSRGTMKMTVELDYRPATVRAYARAGSKRVLETAAPSLIAIGRRNYGVWGYDPVILGRYIEYMAWTQGVDMARVQRPTNFVPRHWHPTHAMLRTRFVIPWQTQEIEEHAGSLPRFLLYTDWELAETEDVLDAMSAPDFDFRRTVVLESAPQPAPLGEGSPARAGGVHVMGQSSDHVDLEIELAEPAILVITDAYSRGWRARALPGSSQQHYELLPANYVLRAVPLAAGRHRLRVEYSPLPYRVGRWISLASAAVFVAAAAGVAAVRVRARGPDAGAA